MIKTFFVTYLDNQGKNHEIEVDTLKGAEFVLTHQILLGPFGAKSVKIEQLLNNQRVEIKNWTRTAKQ